MALMATAGMGLVLSFVGSLDVTLWTPRTQPLRQLTTNIVDTYRIANPAFKYESTHNPRRVLTKPSKAMHNDGYDNEDYDYILYVNDWLGAEETHKCVILPVPFPFSFLRVLIVAVAGT